MLLSCWKNNKEEEQFYAEDNAPIDTTLVDSVVGQTSFSAVNSAIEDAKKAPRRFNNLTQQMLKKLTYLFYVCRHEKLSQTNLCREGKN